MISRTDPHDFDHQLFRLRSVRLDPLNFEAPLHNHGSGARCLFSYDDGVFIAVHIELEPFVATAVRDFRDG